VAQGLQSPEQLGSSSLLMAGGTAGTCFWLACYPADVIKSRWQLDSPSRRQYSSLLDCAQQVRPFVCQSVLCSTWQNASCPHPYHRTSWLHVVVPVQRCRILIAAPRQVPGAAAWPCTLIHAQRRRIIAAATPRCAVMAARSPLPCGVVLQTVRSEGVKGLWKGFTPALARSFPANAACFAVYEVTQQATYRMLGLSR
jgi:hypothetical protein